MKIKVYKSEKGYGFSMLLQSKTLGGDKIKMYLPVGFRKGDEPSETMFIEATDYFLTCYEAKTGEIRPKLFVMSWLGITENKPIEAEYTENDANEFEKNLVESWGGVPGWPVDSDDLPF